MGRARLAIGVVIATVIVAGLGYLAAALLVYDNLSRVAADCGGRFPDNTPASWSTTRPASRSGAPSLDPTPLFVQRFHDARFSSRDPEIQLHAWWLPSDAGTDAPAIIVVPGRGSCVRDPDVLTPAGMLHRLGYSVLVVDLRDHGASTVEDGRYAGGTEEYRDVLGAVDWLVDEGAEPGRIAVLGNSMGAATAIIAAGQDERIAAVWEDSSYADLETRIAEELEQKGYPRLLAPAATLAARIVSGDDFSSHTVLGELKNLSGRRLFIVHGQLDQATYVTHANAITEAAQAADVVTDRWIVADAGHVDAMFMNPEEYERRLGAFFGTVFET